MKHTFSFLALCFLIQQTITLEPLPGAVFSGNHERHHTNFRSLDFLEKLDGKEGFFDAVAIQDAFKLIHLILEIQYGKYDQITKKRSGIYSFENQLITLKDLIIKEQELIKNKIEKTDNRYQTIIKTLHIIKDDFNAKLKALERADKASNAIAQGIQKKLVAFFLEDQKIEDLILRNPEDKLALNNANSVDFFKFLNNLKHFLEDLTKSCTVAHKSYQDLVKKAQESHKL